MEFADLPSEPIEHHSLQDVTGEAKQGDGSHGFRVFELGGLGGNLPWCWQQPNL